MKYRGVAHVHSTHSYDGKERLVALREFLYARGISFALMSEHTDFLDDEAAAKFVAECRELSDEKFVFVPGFEVPYQEAHILMFGCEKFKSSFAADTESLHDWASAASFVALAHPVRNHFRLDEPMKAVIQAVEIWNQQYEGKWLPRSRSAALLDELRGSRPELLAIGGLDFHRREHFGSPLMYIEVDSLRESTILEALCAGKYQFGTDNFVIDATGSYTPTLGERLRSRVIILVIGSGKFVNKVLATLGLSLPKSLKQWIRRWV